MATNERFMPVPPEMVWDTLADPDSYGYWVIGSKDIRDADADWPTPGSRFHHTIGAGPLTIRDHTESLEANPPWRLKLRAKGRPAITAAVTLELIAEDGGTTVRMHEQPDGVFRPLAFFPPVHFMTKWRNAASLKRLEELAVQRA